MQSGDGREAQLLQHVLATTSKGDVQAVLDAIDGFAASQSWLMTIGAVKGRILDAALTNVSAKVVDCLDADKEDRSAITVLLAEFLCRFLC